MFVVTTLEAAPECLFADEILDHGSRERVDVAWSLRLACSGRHA